MFNLSEHITDNDKVINGVWVAIGGNAKIKVSSVDNPQFKRRIKQVLEEHEMTIAMGGLEAAEDLHLITEIYADTVLLDWQNIYFGSDTKTSELAFNRKNALMALRESKYFRDIVIRKANEVALFNKKKHTDILGNSPSSSPGS